MLKAFQALFCTALVALVLLSGCKGEESSSQPEPTTVQSTTAVPTTVATTTEPATKDSAGTVKYDFVAIKQKSGVISDDFDSYVAKKDYKGTVYLKLGNDFEYISSRGASDSVSHKDNSINTCYYIGAVTQQFTAAAVLQLVDCGKLNLEDTLDKFFPDYKPGAEITVENLLNMTSGIKNYIVHSNISDAAAYLDIELTDTVTKENSYEENKKLILDWIFSHPLDTKPSTEFAFSDSNYYLLGEIIAQCSGMSYEAYVKEKLFKPLYMNNSGFDGSIKTAVGYDGDAQGEKLNYPGVGYAACGMISNVSDLLRWTDGIFSDGIISELAVRYMQSAGESNFNCGIYHRDGRLSASGRSGAFSAQFSYKPDKSDIFISLSNYSFSDSSSLHGQFRKYLSNYTVTK